MGMLVYILDMGTVPCAFDIGSESSLSGGFEIEGVGSALANFQLFTTPTWKRLQAIRMTN